MSGTASPPDPTDSIDLSRNNLDRAVSPYLLQHRDNPVHWQVWSPAILAAAQAANKPILLSVGYAACHWCHVMAHESFENPATAAVMNELFVNVKVDREERPDVDAIYMQALHLLGEPGGWPLTMFLSPDGQPFWGGTYFPPESKFGRPGFTEVLHKIAEAWRTKPDAIAKNRTMLMNGLRQAARPQNMEALTFTAPLLDQVAEQVMGHVDPEQGGIGAAPKFPQPGLFELIWRAHLRAPRPEFAAAVMLTITRMAQGGIYDHLGGGFARYSVDGEWLVPHFEKMLYDNAQLIDHMALLDADLNEPLLRQRVAETVQWMLTEMRTPEGAFAASLDADSEGEEGRFYVWQKADIVAALGEDADAFCDAYDVTDEGNWEGKVILRRSLEPDLGDDDHEARLARCRDALLALRAARVRPGCDDKVLADWNGLAIAALASAARQYGQPEWLAAAEEAFAFVQKKMQAGDNRLGHSWRAGQLVFPGLLDDYAAMMRAALILYEVTGAEEYLAQTLRWAKVLDLDFADATHGGYFQTARNAEGLVARLRGVHDNATPAANGLLVGIFARLWYLTGDLDWREHAENQIGAFSGEAARNFFPMATFLNGVDFYLHAIQLTIIGERGTADTEALIDAAWSLSLPNRLVMVVPPGTDLPESHPAHGKTQMDGRATAYVCVGHACGLPQTDPAALTEALRQARTAGSAPPAA